MLNTDKTKKILEDNESRHSDFQIENFIIRGQGDQWAQYKQCLREISSRDASIRDSEARNDALVLATKKSVRFRLWRFLNRKKAGGNGSWPELKLPDGNLDDLKAELDCFLKIAEKLKAELGEISEERRYQLETASWKNKGIKIAAIDILATGRISNQTYDFIFSLPKESQLELFAKLSNKQPMALLGFEPDEIRAITKK
jgi:hypothetical protein